MSEEKNQKYDFDFITQYLGLITIHDNEAAINPRSITDICRDEDGAWIICLIGGENYCLTDDEMSDLEMTIRARADAIKLAHKESIETDVKTQIEAHARAMTELNATIQAGGILLNAPPNPNKRFRQ